MRLSQFFGRGLARRAATPSDIGIRLRLAGWLARRSPVVASQVGRALLYPYTKGTELSSLSGDRVRPVRLGSDRFGGYTSELIATLISFRRRLWLYRSVVLGVRTGLLALVVAFLFYLLDLVGVLGLPVWLPYLLGTVALGGVALILGQHVSYLDVARVVDRQLGLKAQLGTAVELTLEGESTRLARLQVRQATTIARRLSSPQAVSPRVPWRDLRLVGLVAFGILAVSVFDSFGLRAAQADTISQAALDTLDPSLNSWYELDPQAAAERSMGAGSSSGLQSAVDKLKDQLDRKEISPLEYAQQVASVEQQIQQQAQDSARQEAALSDLARSLADTSSTRGIADSLNRGDYADAVRGLSDLAGQTGRLSEQARQDLADRLSEAARNAAGSNEALAQAADRAAQALRSGDSAGAEAALNDLATQVGQASEKIAPQSDLGAALAEAQNAQGQNGAGADGQPGAGDASPGQGDPSTATGSQSPGGQDPATTSGTPGTSGTQGTGAGSASGNRITTDSPSQPLKPDVGGNVLRISGQTASGGSRVRSDTSATPPLTPSSAGTTMIQSGGTRSSDPVVAVGEVNNVPLDLRSIVRDYFTGTSLP